MRRLRYAQAEELTTEELFGRRSDPVAREVLARRYARLVEFVARRFRARGVDHAEDLQQVGMVALLKAIDRFDPDRGIRFTTFAVPTIAGELKRHFRDHGWAMHLPRRLQETYLTVAQVTADAQQSLGRSPTIPEIAERAGLTEEEVIEALESGRATEVGSLDVSLLDDGHDLANTLGGEDQNLDLIEAWADVAPAIRSLPARERMLLHLRFIKGMSQSEIAVSLGYSQMHVSRMLSATLAHLRDAARGETMVPKRRRARKRP